MKDKLGCNIPNDTFSNNKCFAKIIDLISLDIDLKKWQLQGIRYIISLMTKPFVFVVESEN